MAGVIATKDHSLINRGVIWSVVNDDACRQVLERHFQIVAHQHPWLRESVAHFSIYLSYLARRFRFFKKDTTFYPHNDWGKFPRLGSDLYDAMVKESLLLAQSSIDCSYLRLDGPILVYDPHFCLQVFFRVSQTAGGGIA